MKNILTHEFMRDHKTIVQCKVRDALRLGAIHGGWVVWDGRDHRAPLPDDYEVEWYSLGWTMTGIMHSKPGCFNVVPWGQLQPYTEKS